MSEKAGSGDPSNAEFADEPFGRFGIGGKAERGNIHKDVVGPLRFSERESGLAEVIEKDISF